MEPEADAEMKDGAATAPPDSSEQSGPARAEAPSVGAQLPRAMSVDLPDSPANQVAEPSGSGPAVLDTAQERPPLEEQIKTIQTLIKAFGEQPVQVGDKAYLISRAWVNKALALGGDPKFAKQAALTEEPLGPVDNSDIIEEIIPQPDQDTFVRLKEGYGEEQFELFPEDAWQLVSEWYGLEQGQPPIQRQAINTAIDAVTPPNIIFELHPPVFKVHRLWSETSPIPIEQSLKNRNPPPIRLARSVAMPYNEFYKEIKAHAGVSPHQKIRVWTIHPKPAPAPTPAPRPALTPPDSPGREGEADWPPDGWNSMLLSASAFVALDKASRSVLSAVDHTTDANYNGKSPLSLFITQSQTLVIDEEIAKNEHVSSSLNRLKNKDRAAGSRGSAPNLLSLERDGGSGRSSPAPSGPMTRGRAQQKKLGRSTGAVGLQNLGNTCYMNSALQCVRSIEELTKYFLTNEYEKEINKTNPLAFKGQVAMAYGDLLKEIYQQSRGAVSPRDFKNTVGRCRSTFSGWGQQDSQEFLGFLLDGLQEDLSRVKKKPYIEKPDSTDEMIGNEEAIRQMAEQVWDITKKRDDSVIADLFTGMYKSTLKCPVCHKISITFDPFTNLTLPLPVEDMWARTVKFYPLNDAPVEFEVELPKHSAIELLKKFISDRTGVPAERLMGAEEFKNKFFKIYDDNSDVTEEIQSNDVATMHELEAIPTNWPLRGSAKKQPIRSMLVPDEDPVADPRAERMVVPVLHRKRSTYGFRNRDEVITPPHFILLTPQEAQNEDAIRRKILRKVATFSSWGEFADADDASEPDLVVSTQSDADSSGDSKVVANSVEGEEDLVDVTMRDTSDAAATGRTVLKRFNGRDPKWLHANEFLNPKLQNLFDLCYFTDTGNDLTMPSGWTGLEDGKNYHKLSTRIPQSRESADQDSSSPSANTNGGDSENESSSDHQSPDASGPTRMAEETSEDDELVRFVKPAAGPRSGHRGPQNRGQKKFKPSKTYGRKGNKRRNQAMRSAKQQHQDQAFEPAVDVGPQPSPEDHIGGPLVRLGEGIIVEWNEEAWDLVYGGDSKSKDEPQGVRTFLDLEKIEDPVLQERRKNRQARRTKGITLEECLEEFEKAEVLSEQDTWYCPRCKEHRRASKKFDLWKTPDILVVHLKRFSSSGWRRDKLDVLVDFPIEDLDLTSRVLYQEQGKQEIYDLVAVDDHFGGLGGGHYTAWARNFVDGQWYNYNDTSVTPATPQNVVTRAAYLLFYRRRSSVPLGGPRFQEIFDKFDRPPTDSADEDDMADSGEDQRLVVGSSLTGSSSAWTGAGAIRPQAGRGLASSTMATGGAPGEDEELPRYDGGSVTNADSDELRNSVEDEGVGLGDGFRTGSNLGVSNFSSGWTWNSITEGPGRSASLGMEGYASDDAQHDSADEQDRIGTDTEMQFDEGVGVDWQDPGSQDAELPPAPDYSAQIGLSEIQNAVWDQNARDKVISVPAADNDADSMEAAEIRIDEDDIPAHR